MTIRIGKQLLRRALFPATMLLFAVPAVNAQSLPGEGLLGIPSENYANDVERRSAAANQSTFNVLDAACNPFGDLDGDPNPAGPGQGADPACGEIEFNLYLTVRELVHTANEITGNGPTSSSLGFDQEGLGTALRWTAAEELAAIGSAATEFANDQLSNLAGRLNALRFGARGFTVAGFNSPAPSPETMVVTEHVAARGGGASADGRVGDEFSAWGGFLNGSFGYGKKDDTDLENAFDFDGSEITLGLDYRFRNDFVLGVLSGYKEQAIDFDEAASSIRVVDGGIDVEGIGGMLFGLYQGERFFFSASVGFENLEYDVERRIKYGSNNPDRESANSVASSEPEASTVTATLNLGYAFHAGRFTFEPFLNAEYLEITIDEFSEIRSRTPQGEIDFAEFQLNVAEQEVESLDMSLGARLQYTWTPGFGVVVPYARIEAHNEVERDSREILAGYAALGDSSLGNGLLTFSVPTDEVDQHWWTWAAGLSVVLRGGRQRTYDGPIMGGLMAYIQYEAIEDFDNYDQSIVSGGFRYEF